MTESGGTVRLPLFSFNVPEKAEEVELLPLSIGAVKTGKRPSDDVGRAFRVGVLSRLFRAAALPDALDGMRLIVVVVEDLETALDAQGAAHELAEAGEGRGSDDAHGKGAYAAVEVEAVLFRVGRVHLPNEDEEAEQAQHPQHMATALHDAFHGDTAVGVHFHKGRPFLTAAFRAAGEVVREDGLAVGALQFLLHVVGLVDFLFLDRAQGTLGYDALMLFPAATSLRAENLMPAFWRI